MFKRLLLGVVSIYSSNAAYMMPIRTVVKNNSPHMINVLCQASGPMIEKFGGEPGWFVDKWSILNLEPGQEEQLELWIFKATDSILKVSVVSSPEEQVISGDHILINYLKQANSPYLGDATFYRVDQSQLKVTHSGKLKCNMTGSGENFSAQLVIS